MCAQSLVTLLHRARRQDDLDRLADQTHNAFLARFHSRTHRPAPPAVATAATAIAGATATETLVDTTADVRSRVGAPHKQQQQQQPAPPVGSVPLAAGDAAKNAMGMALFLRIQQTEPRLAGKITGMLLELELSELQPLLESAEALAERVLESKTVLAEAGFVIW